MHLVARIEPSASDFSGFRQVEFCPFLFTFTFFGIVLRSRMGETEPAVKLWLIDFRPVEFYSFVYNLFVVILE